MQSAKETASNMAASAKAGMEKTKATAQEKAEKMRTRDPLQKDIAAQKKEERINEAERQKQEARHHNAAARQGGGGAYGGGDYTTGGDFSTATGGGAYGGEYVTTTGGGADPIGYTAEGQARSDYPQGMTGAGANTGLTGPGRRGHHDPNTGRTGFGSGNTY